MKTNWYHLWYHLYFIFGDDASLFLFIYFSFLVIYTLFNYLFTCLFIYLF